MFTTTIELPSDSWLILMSSFPGRMSGSGFRRLGLESKGAPGPPNTSGVGLGRSLLGKGGTGGGKGSEKTADADETGVRRVPLIVRDRSRTVFCPHILPRNAVVLALTEDLAIFMTEGEGAGLVDGLGSTQSGLLVLRNFDESSPRWKDDEELLLVAILSTLGLWPCCGTEFDEVDEGVAEVVLNLLDDDSAPPPLPPSEASARRVSLPPVPPEPALDDPFRCFALLSKVTRSGLLALPGDLYMDRRLV